MKSPRFSRRPRATALVVVLSCVVIMSILLISYLVAMQLDRQSTQNYAQSIKAQELAEGALQEILGDLRQEINAGSLSDGSPAGANYTANSIRIYVPTTNTTVAPARTGFTTGEFSNLPPTLIRVSRSADPFFTTPPPGYAPELLPTNRASAVSSTLPSANRRFVSVDRWNRPLLMGANVPTVFSNRPPDWIYITREGSKTLTTGDIPTMKMSADLGKTNAVLGRYSYVIYEQGGLLDLNTSGYPASALSETDGTNTIAGRGFTAYADLTRLPGMTASTVDQIINWRSKGSLATNGGKFLPGVYTNAATGFLKFQAGDSPLLGRQDLINYFKQTPGLATNLGTLSYLGTFSRSLNAPTWKPSATTGVPSGNTVNYAGLAETAASANRNIPNVRFPAAGTVIHYDDNGIQTSYAVEAGDPLIQRRFSLAKIAWLTPSGPKAGKDQAIQECFGLKWNSSSWRWDYVGPTGSSVQTNIDTLAAVAGQNREPNFFELLKAGILSGSLGRDPGPSNKSVSHGWPLSNAPGVFGSFFENYSASPNLQILKIGAGIIDQADTDSYPTALYLRAFPFSSSSADDLAFNTVYGTENLPYLTRVGAIAAADPAPTAANDPNARIKFWVQPEIWNPHQPPAAAPTAAPHKFRAYAYGSAQGIWSYRGDAANLGYTTYYDDGSGSGANIAAGSIYFTDSGDVSSPFYNTPRLLTLNLVDTGQTPASNLWQPAYSGLPDDQGGQNQFAAFATGEADYPITPFPYNTLAPDWHRAIDKCVIGSPAVYYSLQYEGPDGNWHPYSFMARITQNPNDPRDGTLAINGYRVEGAIVWGAANWMGDAGGIWAACRPDPRTDRFSASQIWVRDWTPNHTMNPWPGAQTRDNMRLTPSISAFVYDVQGPYKASLINLWSVNDPSFPAVSDPVGDSVKSYYSDPDGVVRRGDSYRANMPEAQFSPARPNTGDGCQFYHGDAAVSPASTLSNPGTGSALARRPAILNRPFRSVGELGFAYRDQPFKSLDFWSTTSADAALLDLFGITDGPAVVAGKFNPTHAPGPVLEAILTGVSKNNETLGLRISTTDAQTLATRIISEIQANGPYANRADLVFRLENPILAAFDTRVNATANWANKAHAEAPVRALADVTDTRTWNLMIDVIAQTGRISANADSLDDFAVEGERRYWLHVAIDRFTGEIVDQQLEAVYE